MQPTDIQRIHQIWREHPQHLTRDISPLSWALVNRRLASVFCPGPFYYYILDYAQFELLEVSASYAEMMGAQDAQHNIRDFLSRIHPEDVSYFHRCEQVAGAFLFEHLRPGDFMQYKVSYCYRIRGKDDMYRLFLHQAISLEMDSEKRLSKVLGVHTDISHLTQTNTYHLSFLGINEAPSYYGIDVFANNATQFNRSATLLTQHEWEVLGLLSEGWSAKHIASVLEVSEPTVRKHREHLLEKTGARNTTHMGAIALR
ncbi:MAG: LuxR C-terminal-related transcriptional regulator, partial [Bacteroidota bacterium]